MKSCNMTWRQATVAAAKALLWHLANAEGGEGPEYRLRNALREYVAYYGDE